MSGDAVNNASPNVILSYALHTYLYLLNYSFDRGGIAYHFGASEFTPILSWVHIAQSLVFCAVVC